MEAKETYKGGKRDLPGRQKRPAREAKDALTSFYNAFIIKFIFIMVNASKPQTLNPEPQTPNRSTTRQASSTITKLTN
jgi:hypothetical protein